MRTLLVLSVILSITTTSLAAGDSAYLKRFQTYQFWEDHLPNQADPEFIAFIQEDKPLSNKLQNQWLHQLGKTQDWTTYLTYYQPSEDVSLQCYQHLAEYHAGEPTKALKAARPLWLVGKSQPKACDPLFALLQKSPFFTDDLITKRIELALEARNLSLARYLLKQYPTPKHADIQLLNEIYRSPAKITQLKIGQLHDDYYLYGLKRMVKLNMDQAIRYWQHVKTKKLLNEEQQQSFLAHLALYKAIRNKKDALKWFQKVKKPYYTDVLLDWQIRFALKEQRWPMVEKIISTMPQPDKADPAWQYWLARAKEAQGKRQEAKTSYKKLATLRNYYGFLASMHLKKPPEFEAEQASTNKKLLEPYQVILDEIQTLYENNKKHAASVLINDFILELPKNERSALAYWLNHKLQWYGKSVYVSNWNDDLYNQITLRFPLGHQHTISQQAKRYKLPKEMIFAIIRQESAFRDTVVSHAGAYGLMQVLPKTAKNVAKRGHIPYANKRELFTPNKNIHIGSAYLNYLSGRFNQHPVLVAAAYNAGPNRVDYWLQNHPPKQIDIWIDTLPWHETRNYLKNFIAFYAVYQHLMNQKPDITPFMESFQLD